MGLWTHLDFNIEYNGDSVIFANVSVKDVKPVPLEEGAGAAVGGVGVGGGSLKVTHTYSVHWFDSPLPHSRRAERLRDYSFFPKTLEIHWLSIINSLVLVVLLLGFVIIILMRVLKNDFARSVGKQLKFIWAGVQYASCLPHFIDFFVNQLDNYLISQMTENSSTAILIVSVIYEFAGFSFLNVRFGAFHCFI